MHTLFAARLGSVFRDVGHVKCETIYNRWRDGDMKLANGTHSQQDRKYTLLKIVEQYKQLFSFATALILKH